MLETPARALGVRALLALALTAALVAACGSGSLPSTGAGTQAPAATQASAPTPVASEAETEETEVPTAAATAAPTEAPAATSGATAASGGNEAEKLQGSAAKLADLTSYRMKMQMAGGTFEALGTGLLTFDVVVVLKPEKALQMTMTGISGLGEFGSDGIGYIVIGDEAWVTMGGATFPDTSGNAAAQWDSFSPEKMFGSMYTDYLTGMKAVGEEQKNGVATVHYTADQATLDAAAESLGALIGEGATGWTMDLWIAKDGGYMISAVMGAQAAAAASGSGAFYLSIDISNINDPSNKVTRPT